MKTRHNASYWTGRFFVYFMLVFAAVFFLLPIYLLLITSLKSYQEVSLSAMWTLPKSFSLASFAKAWLGSEGEGFRGLSGNFLNSVWLTIPAALLSAFIGSINGYIFSKWKFKGSDIIFAMLLFGMFIPYQSILIPLVRVLQWLAVLTRPLQNWILNIPVSESLMWLTTWMAQLGA